MKCLKELASEMQLSGRSVMRWSKRLEVPPTVPAHAGIRFSEADARRLVKRWQAYWQQRRNGNSNGNGNGTH